MTDKTKLNQPDEHHGAAYQSSATEPATFAAENAPAGGTVTTSETASRPKRPLITAIEIENFKGIGAPVRIDLRPITLLFGRNSAGKSTILQALCYAHEVLSHRNVDAHRTELGGEHIDLGGFRRFVHRRDLDLAVQLRFELNLGGRDLRPLMHPDDTSLAPYELSELDVDGAKSGSLTVGIRWEKSANVAVVFSYEVAINGESVGRLETASTAGGTVLFANLLHPLLERERAMAGISKQDDANWRSCRLNVTQQSAMPVWNRLLHLHTRELPVEYAAPEQSREMRAAGQSRDVARINKAYTRLSAARREANDRFSYQFSALFVATGRLLHEELARFRYLGPVRDVHALNEAELHRSHASHWASGSAAWALLNDNAGSSSDFVRDISDWMSDKDRLDTGYRLLTRQMVELPGDDALVTQILSLKQTDVPNHKSRRSEMGMPPSPGTILATADESQLEALRRGSETPPVRTFN